MIQGSTPFPQTLQLQLSAMPGGVSAIGTAIRDRLFCDIGLFSSRAVRDLARDSLFTVLGRMTDVAGQPGVSFAAWLALGELPSKLSDEELRRGIVGLRKSSSLFTLEG